MIGYDDPRREDGDENAWDDRPSALCEACEERPGAVAEDGAWLCVVCSSALETTVVLDHATPEGKFVDGGRTVISNWPPKPGTEPVIEHFPPATPAAADEELREQRATGWDAWFDRHPGHTVNGYCLSHPPGCNRRCLDDRPQGPAPWEPAAAVVSAEPTEEQG